MPKRTLVELLHLAAGVAATALIAALAAWAVPSARETIWWVALVSAAFVVGMGVKPLRRAWAGDRDISGDEAGLRG